MTTPVTNESSPRDGSSFWMRGWGYPQATTFVIAITGIGLIIQAMYPDVHLTIPPLPWNLLMVGLPILAGVFLGRLLPGHPLSRSLGGIPVSVVSVLALALLATPGAIWPQGESAPGLAHRFGFDHVFTSFGLGATLLLILLNLSVATGRRCLPLTTRNIRFLLVHAGLLLTLGAACAGAGSRIQLSMPLLEGGEPARTALNTREESFALPFEIRLLDFALEAYAPVAALASPSPSGDWDVQPGEVLLEGGARDRIGPYMIQVDEAIPHSSHMEEAPVPADAPDAGPALRVTAVKDSGETITGWMRAPDTYGGESVLELGQDRYLVLLPPQPKDFASHVMWRVDIAGEWREALIRVNSPFRVAGWVLYQSGYDATEGAASRVSILDAVRDPLYPGVVAGCLLLLAGVTWLLWDAALLMRIENRSDAE